MKSKTIMIILLSAVTVVLFGLLIFIAFSCSKDKSSDTVEPKSTSTGMTAVSSTTDASETISETSDIESTTSLTTTTAATSESSKQNEPQQVQTQQNTSPQQAQAQHNSAQSQQQTPQHPQQPEPQQAAQQTQQQTQQTEQHTEKPTQQYIDYSSIDYKKTDIANSDIYYSSYALGKFSNSLDKDLFGNYSHQTQYGISKSVVSPYIFLVLNYNQNINKEMLGECMFGSVSEEKFMELSDNMNLADYQYFYETNVDFRKYVIDEDFANFLNTISAEYKKYKDGESSKIEQYIDEYFKQNDTNYVRKYFMANTRAMLNETSGNYFITLDPEIRQEYYDNVVIPLYNEFANR